MRRDCSTEPGILIGGKFLKIYVASSWKNQHYPEVVERLSRCYEVYDFRNPTSGDNGLSWSGISPDWVDWHTREFTQALHHPSADHSFDLDMDALNAADVLVLVLPSGRSAHVEAGYHAGNGKPVVVFIPEERSEPELM